MWALDLDDDDVSSAPLVDIADATGDPSTYPACQDEARRLRSAGADALRAPSAALIPGGAHGHRTDGGLVDADPRDGVVWVLFGARPDVRGWQVVEAGRPPARLLTLVRPLMA
jgi:hypothetical protein